MVLPLSGFTAFPNPYMIPFMGMQSWVIGIMFGMAYQGGKRLISKMPNEEFNKLDLNKFGFDQMHEILSRVPEMKAMFAEMRPMVEIMMQELKPLLETLYEQTKDIGGFVEEKLDEAIINTKESVLAYIQRHGLPSFLLGVLMYIPKSEWQKEINKLTKDTPPPPDPSPPPKHIPPTEKIGVNHPDAIRVKKAFRDNQIIYKRLNEKWVPLKQQALIALGKRLKAELKGRTMQEHLKIYGSKKGNVMAQVLQSQIVNALKDLHGWANQKKQLISTNAFLRTSYLKMTGIDLGKI